MCKNICALGMCLEKPMKRRTATTTIKTAIAFCAFHFAYDVQHQHNVQTKSIQLKFFFARFVQEK